MEYLQKILKKSGQASIVESIIFAILGYVLTFLLLFKKDEKKKIFDAIKFKLNKNI